MSRFSSSSFFSTYRPFVCFEVARQLPKGVWRHHLSVSLLYFLILRLNVNFECLWFPACHGRFQLARSPLVQPTRNVTLVSSASNFWFLNAVDRQVAQKKKKKMSQSYRPFFCSPAGLATCKEVRDSVCLLPLLPVDDSTHLHGIVRLGCWEKKEPKGPHTHKANGGNSFFSFLFRIHGDPAGRSEKNQILFI